MLKHTSARFEREKRLVQRAGVKPGDETYPLLVAIVALPALLKRTVFAFLGLACLLLAAIAMLAFWHPLPEGIAMVEDRQGYTLVVDRIKSAGPVRCIDDAHVCFRVSR